MIRKRKINKHKVVPIDVPKVEPDRIKGYDLIPRLIVRYLSVRRRNLVKLIPSLKYSRNVQVRRHTYTSYQVLLLMMIIGLIVDYFEKKGIQITVSTSLGARIHEKVEELAENGRKRLKSKETDR